jgi:hypothetical protein
MLSKTGTHCLVCYVYIPGNHPRTFVLACFQKLVALAIVR